MKFKKKYIRYLKKKQKQTPNKKKQEHIHFRTSPYSCIIHPLQIIIIDQTLNAILSFPQKSGHFQNTEGGKSKRLKKNHKQQNKIPKPKKTSQFYAATCSRPYQSSRHGAWKGRVTDLSTHWRRRGSVYRIISNVSGTSASECALAELSQEFLQSHWLSRPLLIPLFCWIIKPQISLLFLMIKANLFFFFFS